MRCEKRFGRIDAASRWESAFRRTGANLAGQIFSADFRVRAFVFDPRRLIDHDN